MYLVISASLNPNSRSRVLARRAFECLQQRVGERACEFVDLSELDLPLCDAGECYGGADVGPLAEKISAAKGVLIASPVYNYDLSSSVKNLIELTGRAWNEKVVGFICSAGGQGSYMSVMGTAASLMLDFRCLILPRFVFATESAVEGEAITDPGIEERIGQLADDLVRVTSALHAC